MKTFKFQLQISQILSLKFPMTTNIQILIIKPFLSLSPLREMSGMYDTSCPGVPGIAVLGVSRVHQEHLRRLPSSAQPAASLSERTLLLVFVDVWHVSVDGHPIS